MAISKALKRIGGSVRSALGVIDKATEENMQTAEELAEKATNQVEQYKITGDIDALERANSLIEQATTLVNKDNSLRMYERSDELGNLLHDLIIFQCATLQDWHLATNDVGILDEAINKIRPVFENAPKPSHYYILESCALSRTLSYRYFAQEERNEKDGNDCVEVARLGLSAEQKWKKKIELSNQEMETVDAMRPSAEMPLNVPKGIYLYNRAVAIKLQYVAKRKLELLDLYRSLFNSALKCFTPGSNYHTRTAIEIAECERDYIERTNDATNFDTAMDSMNAIRLTSADADTVVNISITKSTLWREKFNQSANPSDLDRALEAAREATEAAEEPNVLRVVALENLGNQLRRRAELQRSIDDMNAAIKSASEAVAIFQNDGSPREARAYASLGKHYGSKYSLFGGDENLKTCVKLLRQAISGSPTEHASQAPLLHSLSQWLREVTVASGDKDALEESIVVQRKALNMIPKDDSERSIMLDGLSSALAMRYKQGRHSQDLMDAISAAEEAVQITPKGHTRYPIHLASLARLLNDRFAYLEEPNDVERAIEAITESIKFSKYSEESQLNYSMVLSSCYHLRYTVKAGISDLDEAIKIAREALDKASATHPQRRHWKTDLERLLAERFKMTEDKDEKRRYLEECQTILHECLDMLPNEHSELGWYLCLLGIRQEQLNQCVPDEDKEQNRKNRTSAAAFFQKGFDAEYTTPLSRIRNAQRGGNAYISVEDWGNATAILSQGINMFQRISSLSLDENDRQKQLRGLSGMSMDACLSYLELGNAEQAVEILEAGRGILANIAMRHHDQLPELKEQDPNLHKQYIDLRHSLSQSLPAVGDRGIDVVAERRQQEVKFQGIQEQIRTLPGMENFNQPMSAEQIKLLACRGPLVSFCVARDFQSHALIITPDAVTSLPLPELLFADIEQKLPLIAGDDRLSLRPPSKRPAANKQTRALLAWLWDAAVKPVLEHLGLLDKNKKGALPRLWWVTSGLIGLMPLHAAGKGSKKSAENAWSHIISSYTSTFSSLKFTRECQSKVSNRPPRMALVTMPQTPARSSLNTEMEAQAVREAFTSSRKGGEEDGESLVELCQPTAAEVFGRVRDNNIDVFHFSCHAEPDLKDPSKTAFLFGNDLTADAPDPLPIRNLRKFNDNADLSTRAPQLAYLSACCTAQHYDRRLLDENIHLAAILQLIGFPAVMGTLWEADDKSAAFIAKTFYEELIRMNNVDEENAEYIQRDDRLAHAFHLAIGACRGAKFGRAKASEDVMLWANFVHFGA